MINKVKRKRSDEQENRAEKEAIVAEVIVGDRGWIVEKLANEIRDNLPEKRFSCEVLDAPSGKADITYFLPYSGQRPVDGGAIGSWFTHQEMVEPAKSRFIDYALAADFCLTPAERYEELLRSAGAKDVETIWHGVDLDLFSPKLKIGVVGRAYHTGRKGEGLLAFIHDLDGLELLFTGTGWPWPHKHYTSAELAEFYRSLDYLLIPSTIEGGPMPLFEALASGVKVIASDVGCVPSFPHIPFERGNGRDLRAVIQGLLEEKTKLRQSVERLTWRRFGEAHARVFERVFQNHGPNPNRRSSGGSAVPLGANAAQYSIIMHGTEKKSLGGPTTRVGNIVRTASSRGVVAKQHYGSSDVIKEMRPSSIAHVFNSWPLKSALAELHSLNRANIPTIYSPIALNLNFRPYFQDLLPSVLKDLKDADQLETTLRQIGRITKPWEPEAGFPPAEGHDNHFDSIREGVSLADHIIFLSAYEEAFVRSIGAAPKASTVVRNGVDTQTMRSADRRLFESAFGISDFILIVGRIETRKNQATPIFALRELDVPIVCIGHVGDPEYFEAMKKWAGHNFIHIDRIDDREMLASAYKAARGLILASWSEGAPLVALEAAAAGTPLLLSTLSSEQEYFGDFAEYTHPCDTAKMREWSEALALDPESPNCRAQRSDMACTQFDISRHVKETLDVYATSVSIQKQKKSGVPSRFAVDFTHVGHALSNGKNLTGVPAVEAYLAREVAERSEFAGAFVWNSPQRRYVPADVKQILNDKRCDAANSKEALLELPSDSSIAVEWERHGASEQDEVQTVPTLEFEELPPLTFGRKLISAAKHTIAALPGPVRRSVSGAIRYIRPSFNSEIEPHHRLFGRKTPPPTIVYRPLEQAPKHHQRRSLRVRAVQKSRKLIGINAHVLFVLGQPWISNERQLDDLISFVQSNNLRLRPLIHDLLYITDTSSFNEGSRRVYAERLLKLLAVSDRAIVTSQCVERELQNLISTRKMLLKIQRIRLGLPMGIHEAPPTRPSIPLPPNFLMYVSSMNARKNHRFLIDVWQDLYPELRANKATADVGLILVGSPQAGFEEFKDPKFLKKLQKNNIHVLDGINDGELAWLYQNCLFTVYPSRSEGWGFPPLESLTFEKPCIVSSTVPSANETKNGGLMKIVPNDFYAWRSALHALICQSSLREGFAERAKEFSPDLWRVAAKAIVEE